MDAGRVSALIDFAKEHETQLPWGDNVPEAKAKFLRERFGPHADVEIVGPLAPKGAVNGLVIRDGYLVAEFGDTHRVDEIASATKSFLSTLMGVAVDRGLIESLDESVFERSGLELLSTPHNRMITWHHLLQQTSEWDGELFGKFPTGHSGTRTDEPLRRPGEYFEYNDVRTNLLSRCLLELFGEPLPEVLQDAVMRPLGASDTWAWHGYSTSKVMVNGRMIESVSGGAHWGGGIWMSSQDLAGFGQLYLQDGVWGSQRLLPPDWVGLTRRSCPRNYMYGYLWWLQHDAAGKQVSFAAQGGGCHCCFVIPEHELVIVVRWVQDEAWMQFLDQALQLVIDRPPLGPVVYDFERVNG